MLLCWIIGWLGFYLWLWWGWRRKWAPPLPSWLWVHWYFALTHPFSVSFAWVVFKCLMALALRSFSISLFSPRSSSFSYNKLYKTQIQVFSFRVSSLSPPLYTKPIISSIFTATKQKVKQKHLFYKKITTQDLIGTGKPQLTHSPKIKS